VTEVPVNGAWANLTLDLSEHEDWNGVIDQIRIDPIQSADAVEWIGIDRIELQGVSMKVLVAPKIGDDYTIRTDYVSQLIDPANNWPTSYARADTFKTYLLLLWPFTGTTGNPPPQYSGVEDDDLEDLVSMVDTGGLEFNVEVGGLRPWCILVENPSNPAPYNPCEVSGFDWDNFGEDTADGEIPKLLRWTDAGGVVDSITADHPIMRSWSGPSTPPNLPSGDNAELEYYVNELLDYFEAIEDEFSGLSLQVPRFGIIESLGYFDVYAPGKTYSHLVPEIDGLDFEVYIETLMTEAATRGVTIDHFDIDFTFGKYGAGVGDTCEEEDLVDYGPILAAIEICRENGLEVGLTFTDCGSVDCEGAALDLGARKRAVRYANEFLQLEQPDRALVQAWLPNPSVTGPESTANTFFDMAGEIAETFPPSITYEFSRSKDGWTTDDLTEQQDPVGQDWDVNGVWLFTAQSSPELIGPEFLIEAVLFDRIQVRAANANNPGDSLGVEWKDENGTWYSSATQTFPTDGT
jgi:hypothetical protein